MSPPAPWWAMESCDSRLKQRLAPAIAPPASAAYKGLGVVPFLGCSLVATSSGRGLNESPVEIRGQEFIAEFPVRVILLEQLFELG